jgi:hypothetical protein
MPVVDRTIAMARDETIRPEGRSNRISGGWEHTYEMKDEVAGEPKPATRALIDAVTEASWNEAVHRIGAAPSNPVPLWTLLASRILRAVADGERDPQRIKRFALDGLNECEGFGKVRRP